MLKKRLPHSDFSKIIVRELPKTFHLLRLAFLYFLKNFFQIFFLFEL